MQNKRREIIKLGAAAGALALAPAGGRLFASTLAPGTSAAALGYWQGGVALADFSSVHAGWVAACPKSARECELPLQGGLADAAIVAGRAGDYLLRIVGGELADVLSIDAHYGTARHMLWRSWREGDAIRHGGGGPDTLERPGGRGAALVGTTGQRGHNDPSASTAWRLRPASAVACELARTAFAGS